MYDSLTVPLLAWGSLAGSAWVLLAGIALSGSRPHLLNGCLLLAVVGAGGLRYHQSTRLSPPHHVRHAINWGERGLLTGHVDGEPEPPEWMRSAVSVSCCALNRGSRRAPRHSALRGWFWSLCATRT